MFSSKETPQRSPPGSRYKVNSMSNDVTCLSSRHSSLYETRLAKIWNTSRWKFQRVFTLVANHICSNRLPRLTSIFRPRRKASVQTRANFAPGTFRSSVPPSQYCSRRELVGCCPVNKVYLIHFYYFGGELAPRKVYL